MAMLNYQMVYDYTIVIPVSFHLWETGLSSEPFLRGAALISVNSRDQLDAVREIRKMWGETGETSAPIRISVKAWRMPGDMQPSMNHNES